MLGAIIGDLAGSVYEFGQIKQISRVECKQLLKNNCFFSDDTILTMAILKSSLTDKNYEKALKEFCLKYENYKPNFSPYFNSPFSPNFIKWAHANTQGLSSGNSAMMRISPIGFLFNNEEDIIKNTYLATIPSHNSEEAIECATIISRIIFNARYNMSKMDIINKLHLNITKPQINKFNSTCKETIDVCLYSLFTSNSFEESIKKVLSFGGDTDTNACIVGSMAEAMFGISDDLKIKAKKYLPKEFNDLLDLGYKRKGILKMDK